MTFLIEVLFKQNKTKENNNAFSSNLRNSLGFDTKEALFTFRKSRLYLLD